MTELLVAKLLCMAGVFACMLLGALLPVRFLEADAGKAPRPRKVLALCNSFGGGVFLATCFNALLPAVRAKGAGPGAQPTHPCWSSAGGRASPFSWHRFLGLCNPPGCTPPTSSFPFSFCIGGATRQSPYCAGPGLAGAASSLGSPPWVVGVPAPGPAAAPQVCVGGERRRGRGRSPGAGRRGQHPDHCRPRAPPPAAAGAEPGPREHRLPAGRDHHAAGLLPDPAPGAAGADLPQGEAALHRPGDLQRGLGRGQRLRVREPLHGRRAGPRPRPPPARAGAAGRRPPAPAQPGLGAVGALGLRGPGAGPAGGGRACGQPVRGRGRARDAGGRGAGRQHGPERRAAAARGQAGGHGERHDPPGHRRGPGHRERPRPGGQRGVRAAAGPGGRHLPLRHLPGSPGQGAGGQERPPAQGPLPGAGLRRAGRHGLPQVIREEVGERPVLPTTHSPDSPGTPGSLPAARRPRPEPPAPSRPADHAEGTPTPHGRRLRDSRVPEGRRPPPAGPSPATTPPEGSTSDVGGTRGLGPRSTAHPAAAARQTTSIRTAPPPPSAVARGAVSPGSPPPGGRRGPGRPARGQLKAETLDRRHGSRPCWGPRQAPCAPWPSALPPE